MHEADADEKFISTSNAFDMQLGYKGRDLVGLKFRDLVAEDDRHKILAHREFEAEHGKTVPLVVFVRCATGDLMRVMVRMDDVGGSKVPLRRGSAPGRDLRGLPVAAGLHHHPPERVDALLRGRHQHVQGPGHDGHVRASGEGLPGLG